jgi:hypothetical protein
MPPRRRGPGPKYDPSDYIVPPSQKNGHSERIQFRAQSTMARALKIIAGAKVFPFGTDQDVARWCLKFGLEHLEKLEPELEGLSTVLGQCRLANELLRDELYRFQFLEMFTNLRNAVAQHISHGETDEAKHLVHKTLDTIIAMPTEPEREGRWREKYLKQFEEFSFLMGSK